MDPVSGMQTIMDAIDVAPLALKIIGVLVSLVGLNLGFMAYRKSKAITSRG